MVINMNEKGAKKLSLIDELLIEDVSSMSIDELEENISILKEIIFWFIVMGCISGLIVSFKIL